MNKKLLTVAIAGAMAAPMTAQAVKYKLSGQVNRAIVFMDDGVQSDVRNSDSNASGTRFRFRGSEDLGNGMSVGMYYELQTSSPAGGSGGQRPDMDQGRNAGDGIGIRQANVWFSGNWGKLTIGQQDGAGNGATEADLSGTGLVTPPGRTSYDGGLLWRFKAGGGQVGTARGGSTWTNYDSFSRYDAIRYDTPALGPATLSASVGNDQLWEVAGRVNTAIGGGEISGAAFYASDTGVSNVDKRWGGSLSYMFSQGTNISGFYAKNEPENQSATNPDSDVFGIKLGHKWGPHAVSVSYSEAEDVGGVGFEDTGWNIGYVHNLKKANTQLYAGFLHAELDVPATTGGSVEDHNTFVVGARVQFN